MYFVVAFFQKIKEKNNLREMLTKFSVFLFHFLKTWHQHEVNLVFRFSFKFFIFLHGITHCRLK